MNADRQQEILDEVIVLQHDSSTNRKKMTFASAWNEVQRRRPDLFEEEGHERMPPPVGYARETIDSGLAARAEAARERAKARGAIISASRPSDEVTVECLGGWSIWA
jgi:hypothetical protein